jgi:hypothetical protein
MKRILIVFALLAVVFCFLNSEEIPRPTYDNSVIFSVTYSIAYGESTEIGYIKNQFGYGLYAPLLFSGFVGVDMDWDTDIDNIGDSIQTFKDRVDACIEKAREFNVGIHLTLTYGITRNVKYYKTAKEEDIRNAQWYNDNNISSQSQMSGTSLASGSNSGSFIKMNHADEEKIGQPMADSSVINDYVFSTPSRYARKLRAHLEAKVSAAFAYLKLVQDANPDVLIIISAPGESELNKFRLNESQYLQTYFCDYSPYAVLEFRDWIKHEGLYAGGEKYSGEGYSNGGSRYQGASGLANFNSDFGTSFSTWSLKYYNWSLSDPVDTDYTDGFNPDPHIIPISQYIYNGMKPTSGSNYISGGFDPPRVMQTPGTNDFYDLWHTFRETMISHYVKDMAKIARESGFPKAHYYTHQIPADYLFGTRPNDPLIPYLNPRYYSSASPLWTADCYSDTGLGITLYDINFGTWIARTSKYVLPAVSSLSDDWAALEYNPEVHPWSGIPMSPVSTIYSQFMNLYNYNVHVISLYRWSGDPEWQYKNTNRETAAKQFFDAVKDKARQSVTTVFTPKQVEGFAGSYNSITGLVNLSWSSKIWPDLTHNWSDWGDFKEFVIYRGYTEDFITNTSTEIVRKTGSSHIDSGFAWGTTVYYKIAAVNSNGEIGPMQTVSVVVPEGAPDPILNVSRDRLNFGHIIGSAAPPTQSYLVSNSGSGALNWTATDDAEWLNCAPDSGIIGAVVTASVNPTGLSVGTYNATITINAPQAANSPQTITVYLTVKKSSQNKLPFGEFATPVNNSTVRSSIPVTGWVLDDVGVESVRIYRDPVQGEGTNIVYIGDALFVEGARPDIVAAFPDYPSNYKAGWGYMMLTNFLPNGGNGTFKLYAIAKDTFGNEVTLGTKTIICDNANAVKPFGAIDTPRQGGTASGSSYRNHGWALTPLPNSIPTNGSTIYVLIDSVNIGHPVYNIHRSDVAALFPTYANSSGAGGYFDIDTTPYADGIHTIAWIATDFAGNSDGIGSRYFTIQNTGSTARVSGTKNQKSSVIGYWSLFNNDLSLLPLDDSTPVAVVKGFNKNEKPFKSYHNDKGFITVKIRELERVEIHFFDSTLNVEPRTLNLSPLPIGSTLDSQKGVFYWLPGPGFVGDYVFDFVITEGPLSKIKMKRKQVKIKILPLFIKE